MAWGFAKKKEPPKQHEVQAVGSHNSNQPIAERPATEIFWVPIDPLPDFLADHTLLSEEYPDRIREHCSRWIQFISALWNWHDRAAFCLRYLSGFSPGELHIFLLARAFDPHDTALLKTDLRALLQAHAILFENSVPRRTQGNAIDPRSLPIEPYLCELSQYRTRSLWEGHGHARHGQGWTGKKPDWVVPDDLVEPLVYFPWWGPGGPFLLPMESLVSQNAECSLSVYLQPTELRPREAAWVRLLSAKADSQGEQSQQDAWAGGSHRKADPAASLAARLYIANFRRLAHPFLVSVQCVAGQNDKTTARSVAGAVEGVVHDLPLGRQFQDDDDLPSGSHFRDDDQDTLLAQYHLLEFADQHLRGVSDYQARLPYLVDAQGAATVFRFPVSVRGGVPGVPVRQQPPDFEPGDRSTVVPPGHVNLGTLCQGGNVTIEKDAFCKHSLITGFTGSGKTTTILRLLHQFLDMGIPFLVIESAKQEYRGLLGVSAVREAPEPRLRVYTVGNELCAPFRLNPFEVLPGVRVEAHISRLQTCFEGALPPIGPLSSMIYESLLDTYRDRGWMLTDVGPEVGEICHRRFPAMPEFAERMSKLVVDRKYDGEVRNNLIAAIGGRIKPLTIGSKGRIFERTDAGQAGQPRPAPTIGEIFKIPTILELNDLNLEDKALVVMFLLTFLREYREREYWTDGQDASGKLKHVTVVEEAHNVLKETGSTQDAEAGTADTRHRAVEAFCSMLTEIRSFGEGLIIADQSPEKLARDAMRNTNVQIAHQLRDQHDREAVANAMIMDDDQRDYLGRLQPGHAALFVTGLEKATFISVAPYFPMRSEDIARRPPREDADAWKAWLTEFPGDGFGHVDGKPITDEYVGEYMRPWTAGYQRLDLPFLNCTHCSCVSNCDPRRRDIVAGRSITDTDRRLILGEIYDSQRTEGYTEEQAWEDAVDHFRAVASALGLEAMGSTVWCLFAHAWHQVMINSKASSEYRPLEHRVSPAMVEQFRSAFLRTADPE